MGLRVELVSGRAEAPWGRIDRKQGVVLGLKSASNGLLPGGKGQGIQHASRELEFGCQRDRRQFGEPRVEFGKPGKS